MPQKKGAPVRAGKTASGRGGHGAAARSAAPKAGSKSPKHRGHRPEGAAAPATGSGKKPRWGASGSEAAVISDRRAGRADGRPGRQQRAAYGRPTERPRGEQGEARETRRPNWEPRAKQSRFEARAERGGDRAQRGYDRDDRPARSFDRSERSAAERSPRSSDRGDRPDRPGRPAEDRPRRELRDERPRRQFAEDRTRREHRGDRPARAPRDEAPVARFVPEPDLVLERLAAKAITAETVEGTGFAELGLGQNIVRALAELGAEAPFPIQAGTIPAVLDGRDVLGRGRTGSGKTIAFGAPLVERLLRMQAGSSERRRFGRRPRALVLAPTRELALQIDATVQPIARSVGLFTTQLYGGVPYARQLGALERGVDIVIGTPGRIQDLASRGRLDLSEVVVTVLDEADHMAELGFLEPVQELLRLTAPGGQRLLYSATLDTGVMGLIDEFLVDPVVFEVAGEDQASGTIEHRALLIDQRDKLAILAELVAGRERTLVFARTRAFAEQLADHLDDAGLDADAIHGDLTQARRQRALDRFSKGRTAVLVATDVAARGIHVDDVDLVVQADAPDEYKAYLHRSGRTGRAGRSGTVVTLVPRNRRRRVEELLARAEIEAEWTAVRPGELGRADVSPPR